MLDCKVEVRKYVLIAHPERWSQKSERVVVQSPMLQIPSTVSQVPIRHYHGKRENLVCFIPRTDIEKDSSDAYEKSQVGRDSIFVNAHGVALFDSPPSNDFSYKHSDKFWISIDADTDGYKECVSVINLRTFESGTVQIDQVCWYPKIRGPGQELWTLGGRSREWKLYGPKKFKYMSFVIYQHMDGTPSTIGFVEVPTTDVPLIDKSLLSVQKSRALFELQLRCMLEDPESIGASLPIQPASPDFEHAQTASNEKKKATESQTITSMPRNFGFWRSIITAALECQRRWKGLYALENSIAHPQQPLRSISRPSIDLEIDFEEAEDDSNVCIASQFNTRNSSPSIDARNERLPIKELDHLDGDGVFEALSLYDIVNDERNEPFISLTDSATMNDPTAAIRKRYNENKTEHNPLLDALCDQNNPQCRYTSISTKLHYHLYADKCRRSLPGFDNRYTNAYWRPPIHEHCISRTGPYPGRVGNCLLANSPIRHPNHTCCEWDPADLNAIPFTEEDELRNIKERGEARIKEVEASRKRIKIHDTRSLCKLEVMTGESLGSEDLAALGPAGERFKTTLHEFEAELGAGDWDTDVENLHDIEVNSEDEDEDEMWDEWGKDPAIDIPSTGLPTWNF